MAYGSPENSLDINRYLEDIFRGSVVPPGVRAETIKKYSLFGNKSPSNSILESLRRKLSIALSPSDIDVFLAFKHWFPKLEELAGKVEKDHYSTVIGLPLFPFRSDSVFHSYYEPFMQALNSPDSELRVEFINGFCNEKGFFDLWKTRLLNMHLDSEKDSLLFAAHSLPTSEFPEDSYKNEFFSFAQRLADLYPDVENLTGFQGTGKRGGSWLGPAIERVVLESGLSGTVSLVPLGFVNDHLEVLYDLDLEFSGFLSQQHISYRRSDLFNDSDDFVAFLRDLVMSRLDAE